MGTRDLAFGGVMCALCSVCIILSSLFHLITPLIFACVFYCVCAQKSGATVATIVVVASNIIGFFLGGIGGGEILFSALYFSPLAIIVFCTKKLDKTGLQVVLRAVIFSVFAICVYVLFATVLKGFVGFDVESVKIGELRVGVYLLGVVWMVATVLFGFALDKGVAYVLKRFTKK
ncbi:MAG: hypothetical protein IKC35_01025 [Clostridia bacterium]|nr:hypothetical protein [Clostridia bacterium]